jgi:tRNA1Val (adenine37-N6)-methyltransferase
MANQWFRFKQFTIRQDQCAMKVGTDGVILGAWTGLKDTASALDIGTGTGLLAMMLAQRSAGLMIDAIEIDPSAALQAAKNVADSVFAGRIRVQHADFRKFAPKPGNSYDLVICNPPYFDSSYKSGRASRTLARHADTLNPGMLFSGAATLLNERGRISIILPSGQAASAIEHAGLHGLFPGRMLEVIPVPGAAPKRLCLEFSRVNAAPATQSLVVESGGRHGYSDAYRALTKDFYLAF